MPTPDADRPQYHDGTVIPESIDESTRQAERGENPATGAKTTEGAELAPTFAASTPITPATGAAAGGTAVVITGDNLGGTTSVTFGGVAGTAFSVIDERHIHVTTPAHATGAVNVVLVNAAGNATKTNGYTYT